MPIKDRPGRFSAPAAAAAAMATATLVFVCACAVRAVAAADAAASTPPSTHTMRRPPPLNDATTVTYTDGEHEWTGEVVHLSWSPRAFLFRRFVTDAEAEHIKQKAAALLQKSTVVDNETGEERDSDVRTSTGTFFDKGADEVIARVEARVAQVTYLPVDNQEGLQVLKYVDGQEYTAHFDYFFDKKNQDAAEGGQRVATALMYLSTPEEGGETVFPDAENETPPSAGLSPCAARGGLANKPVKGDMLLFYSLTPGGEVDPKSLHASCPTLKGEKWSATKWIHVGGFRVGADKQRAKWAGGCVDQSEYCAAWAATGECDKNAGYMRTNCRRACRLCSGDSAAAAGAAGADAAAAAPAA